MYIHYGAYERQRIMCKLAPGMKTSTGRPSASSFNTVKLCSPNAWRPTGSTRGGGISGCGIGGVGGCRSGVGVRGLRCHVGWTCCICAGRCVGCACCVGSVVAGTCCVCAGRWVGCACCVGIVVAGNAKDGDVKIGSTYSGSARCVGCVCRVGERVGRVCFGSVGQVGCAVVGGGVGQDCVHVGSGEGGFGGGASGPAAATATGPAALDASAATGGTRGPAAATATGPGALGASAAAAAGALEGTGASGPAAAAAAGPGAVDVGAAAALEGGAAAAEPESYECASAFVSTPQQVHVCLHVWVGTGRQGTRARGCGCEPGEAGAAAGTS